MINPWKYVACFHTVADEGRHCRESQTIHQHHKTNCSAGKDAITDIPRTSALTWNNPIASLSEIKAHLIANHNLDHRKTNLSRRLQEMGYKLSIVSRGHTSTDKTNLPDISDEGWERLMRDPAAKEAMSAGWGTVYAWLRNPAPVPRRLGVKGQGQGQRMRRSQGSRQAAEGEGMVSAEQIMVDGDEQSGEDDVGDATPESGVDGSILSTQHLTSGISTVSPRWPVLMARYLHPRWTMSADRLRVHDTIRNSLCTVITGKCNLIYVWLRG